MLWLAGCAIGPPQPDLVRLYETVRTDGEQPPVILIPGLMGSRLESGTQGEIWPGSVFNFVFSRYEHTALDIDPETLLPRVGDTRATQITGEFVGRDFYASIIDALESAGGYVRTEPGEPPRSGERQYYIFTYDWRLDNVHSVRQLDRFIEQIRDDHDDPDLEFDVIAHSMGGMIARYYMRYGTADVTGDDAYPVNYHGEDRIRRIVLLGTPSLGTVESLKSFIDGHRIGGRVIPPEVLITFPSFYQFFPHPLNDWLLDIDGEPVDADPFDVSTWQRFEWSIFNPGLRAEIIARHDDPEAGRARVELLERYFRKHIERGRRFIWSLSVDMERRPWEFVVFGGDCTLTPARMVVEEVGSEYMLQHKPGDIRNPRPGVDFSRLMLEPGDGVVTKASLLARESLDPSVPRHRWSFFPLDYPLFLCAKHSQLTTNLFFQDNLLHFLLDRD